MHSDGDSAARPAGGNVNRETSLGNGRPGQETVEVLGPGAQDCMVSVQAAGRKAHVSSHSHTSQPASSWERAVWRGRWRAQVRETGARGERSPAERQASRLSTRRHGDPPTRGEQDVRQSSQTDHRLRKHMHCLGSPAGVKLCKESEEVVYTEAGRL